MVTTLVLRLRCIAGRNGLGGDRIAAITPTPGVLTDSGVQPFLPTDRVSFPTLETGSMYSSL